MTTLMLDFDDGAEFDTGRWDFLCQALEIDDGACQFEKHMTRRGYHVIIELPGEYPPLAVVAMQAILGSDPRREIFNVVRALTLANVPAFWRQSGRWNTLYSEKLDRSESRMTINPKDFSSGRPKLGVEVLGGADVAVWRVSAIEETTYDDRPRLILTVEEFPELAYWLNVTGIKTLVGKLGDNEQKWIGKQVPFIRANTTDPRTHKQVEVLWIADGDKWEELLSQYAGGRRARVSAGKMGGAKRAAKKAGGKK